MYEAEDTSRLVRYRGGKVGFRFQSLYDAEEEAIVLLTTYAPF